jgi:hypothetical protein
MNYEFCLNPLSLPVDTRENAKQYLNDIFCGIAGLSSSENNMVLYADKNIDETKISADWTYSDYKSDLLESNERDLAGFVLELETRSPFLDFINDGDFLQLAEYEMKMFRHSPMIGPEYDIIKFACLQNAILLSLPTNDLCRRSTISILITNATTNYTDEIVLLNIFDATFAHIPQYNWKNNLSDTIVFSEAFNHWYSELTEKNKLHIANLLKRADEMRFSGTIKQTKAIEGSEKAIREWRGGAPDIGSGRIRILYKSEQHKFYVLYGFIKTSENEYVTAVKRAEYALAELLLQT